MVEIQNRFAALSQEETDSWGAQVLDATRYWNTKQEHNNQLNL